MPSNQKDARTDQTAETPLLLTMRQACAMTALSRSYGYQLARSGEWQSIRVGRAIRLVKKSIEIWVSDKLNEN